MENIDVDTNLPQDMVDQIRRQEEEDQRREQGDDESLMRPTIGEQPSLEEPKKEYTPIRNRKAYQKLLRNVGKAVAYLELVTNKRNLYDVKDEGNALGDLSVAAYKALEYVKEALKENEARKSGGSASKDDKDKNGNRRVPRRVWPDGGKKPQMSLD